LSLSQKKQQLLDLGPGVIFREGLDLLDQGDQKGALRHFRRVLSYAERTGERSDIAWALLHMAKVMRTQHQYHVVIKILERARSAFEDTRNQFGVASVCLELSLANRELDRNALALEYAHQAVKKLEPMEMTLELGWAYDNLSVLKYNLYQTDAVLSLAQKARAIFHEFNSPFGMAWNACHMGALCLESGRVERAGHYYSEAYKIFKSLKSKKGLGYALLGWVSVLIRQSDFEGAPVLLSKAKVIFKELQNKEAIGWCALHEAGINRLVGHPEKSVEKNKEALQFFKQARNQEGVAWALFQMGQIYRDKGMLVRAWQSFREAHNMHADVGNKKGIGWVDCEWGRTYLELNDFSHARESFIKARRVSEQIGDERLKVEADKNMAVLHLEEGQIQKATGLMNSCLEEAGKLSAKDLQVDILFERARIFLLVGALKEAQKDLNQAEDIIKSKGLNRFQLLLTVFKGELMAEMGQSKEAVQYFKSSAVQASKEKNPRVRLLAAMGLIQFALRTDEIHKYENLLNEAEKMVRSDNSRKLKSKLLALKGLWAYRSTQNIPTRHFNQSLEIAKDGNILIWERQLLSLLIQIYKDAHLEAEEKSASNRMKRLLAEEPVDLHLVRPKENIFQGLPISVVL